VEKYGRTGQATDDNITWQMLFACWIAKATDMLRICNTSVFHSTIGYANASEYYVICTFPVLFNCCLMLGEY
jgi:hypothetical protein